MFKVEIEFGLFSDKVVVETGDFEIVKIISDFISFQESYGWCVDYKAVSIDDEDFEDDSFDEFEDCEFDENGVAWWKDEDGTWYFYDDESCEWCEWDESYDEEEEVVEEEVDSSEE